MVANGTIAASTQLLSPPLSWADNADPLIDNFPFVNDDFWVLLAFVGANVVLSRLFKYKPTSSSTPFFFLYHSFVAGFCALGFIIGCFVADFGVNILTCEPLKTFSELGFRGEVKSYIVYLAIVVKLIQVIEAIWVRSLLSQITFFTELMIAIAGMKYNGTDIIWIGGLVNLPFIFVTNYINTVEVAGEDMDTMVNKMFPFSMFNFSNFRLNLCTLAVLFQSTVLLVHGAYTMSISDCAFPKTWSALEFVFIAVGLVVYPKVYAAEYILKEKQN